MILNRDCSISHIVLLMCAPFMLVTVALQGDYRLATSALEALGELSVGASDLMIPFMENLIPFIITSMQDSTSAHRREVI